MKKLMRERQPDMLPDMISSKAFEGSTPSGMRKEVTWLCSRRILRRYLGLLSQ